LEEIAPNIAQKSTQKTKSLEENAAKIVLFEKKTFFNFCSIFVEKTIVKILLLVAEHLPSLFPFSANVVAEHII
jgi:hypothetical protein